jgi:phage portal protein BeeE
MAKRGFNLRVISGNKAVTLWGDSNEGWNVISGNGVKKDSVSDLASKVAIVFRGMTLRANAVSSIPFDMTDLKGTVIDSSDDWKNECGFLPNPESLMWLIEGAWTLYGKAYLHQSRNTYDYVKILRYLAPESVSWDELKKMFMRNNKPFPPALDKNGKPEKGESIVSAYMPDPDVENGPPLKSPGSAAFAAMGILYNLDQSSLSFFKNGMLHTYIFKVGAGTQQADVELLEEKVNQKLRGTWNAFKALFLKTEKFEPVDIGGGLDWLSNVPLTKEKREDIAIALGVPMSMLFTDSASGLGGGGVASSDDKKIITMTALPDWKNIVRQLNEQVFIPAGYRLVERHEKLDVFKETESALGDTLTKYVTAFNTNPELAVELAGLLGITISDEQKSRLMTIARKKPEPTQFETINQSSDKPVNQEEPAPDTMKSIEYNKELQRYQRKALKKIGQVVEFESEIIPLDILRGIKEGLVSCQSEDAIKSLFATKGVMKSRDIDRINNDAILKLVDAINNAVEK